MHLGCLNFCNVIWFFRNAIWPTTYVKTQWWTKTTEIKQKRCLFFGSLGKVFCQTLPFPCFLVCWATEPAAEVCLQLPQMSVPVILGSLKAVSRQRNFDLLLFPLQKVSVKSLCKKKKGFVWVLEHSVMLFTTVSYLFLCQNHLITVVQKSKICRKCWKTSIRERSGSAAYSAPFSCILDTAFIYQAFLG